MIESNIQAKVVGHARLAGCIARKLDFGMGWPDYLFLYKGQTMFIEFKTIRGRLSLLQKHMHKTLIDAGFKVEVCNNVDEGYELINNFVGNKS